MLTMMFILSWGFSRVFNIMNMFANLFSLICINLRLWTSFALDKVTNRSCARGPPLPQTSSLSRQKQNFELKPYFGVYRVHPVMRNCHLQQVYHYLLSSQPPVLSSGGAGALSRLVWSSDDIFINCQKDKNFTLNIFNL